MAFFGGADFGWNPIQNIGGVVRVARNVVGPYDVIPGFDPVKTVVTGGSVKGASTSTPNGAMYYDGNGVVQEYSNGQWNPYNAGNTSGNTGQTLGRNTGSGGSSAPVSTWTPQNQQMYDYSVGEINRQLGRLGNQYNAAVGNIDSTYNQRLGGLQSARGQAKENFDFGTTTNQQNYTTDQNRIQSQASQGLRGLLRQLGAMGAGGGSAYLYSAPEAVGQFAQEQLSGAGQGYAQNARELDKTFTTFSRDADNQEKQLKDWRTQGRRQAESQRQQARVSLLETLQKLNAERAQAQGGNVAAALEKYTPQISRAEGQIDALARFRPTFDGKTPVYQAPELSRFNIANNPQAQLTPMGAGMGARTPYMNMLLGRDEQEERLA